MEKRIRPWSHTNEPHRLLSSVRYTFGSYKRENNFTWLQKRSFYHHNKRCFDKNERGRGFWKFNNSLLKDPTFIQKVKDAILKVKRQYAPISYNREIISNIENHDFQPILNDQLFFEMLLLEIRTTSINYAKRKKRDDSLIIQKLEEHIQILENTVDGDNELECKKKDLETYRKNIMDGVIIRSRAQWIKEGGGGEVTKYFCNLEKRLFTSKRTSVLINSSNNEITDSKEICKKVKNFYQSLYSSRENQLIDVDLDQLLNRDTPKISDADKEKMEMQNVFTMEEAGKVLNNIKNDKSPGSDGFSVNFFTFFWKDLGVHLVRSINYGLKAGKLSTTQTQGLITCISKGKK